MPPTSHTGPPARSAAASSNGRNGSSGPSVSETDGATDGDSAGPGSVARRPGPAPATAPASGRP